MKCKIYLDWLQVWPHSYWIWTWQTFYPPKFTDSDEYRVASKWLGDQTLGPDDAADGSDPSLTYAWKRYEELSEILESLDKKGDNLMKNAGIAAALIGVAVNTFHVDANVFMLTTLGMFIVALTIVTRACSPKDVTTGPSISLVVDDVRKKAMKDHILAGALHCAVVGRSKLNEWKASRVLAASNWFCGGLLVLLLGVIWTMIFAKPPAAELAL